MSAAMVRRRSLLPRDRNRWTVWKDLRHGVRLSTLRCEALNSQLSASVLTYTATAQLDLTYKNTTGTWVNGSIIAETIFRVNVQCSDCCYALFSSVSISSYAHFVRLRQTAGSNGKTVTPKPDFSHAFQISSPFFPVWYWTGDPADMPTTPVETQNCDVNTAFASAGMSASGTAAGVTATVTVATNFRAGINKGKNLQSPWNDTYSWICFE
jgi:hypothetical protein